MTLIRYILPIALLLRSADLVAQLDTIHWLPPMHARDEWGPQFLYLSTPEQESFPVSIRDGAGTLLTTVNISNSQPYRYDLGSSSNTPVLVSQDELHKAVKGKGLVIDGPKKFYAYFRVHASSNNHAGDLTCKGRAALGRKFRIGHLIQKVDDMDRRSNFAGVMATEDSTWVILSDFDPQTDFRVGSANTQLGGPASVLLQKGESVVFAEYITSDEFEQPPNGLMGALLESSKPVAVNCGSWIGAPVVFMAHDIGIDQIAPFEKTGKEYILCKGNGSAILEHPIIIAHVDDTKVWLNGNANPSATLDAGEYFVVETSAYSSYGNLYIRSSEPVFVYQMIGGASTGDDAMRTAGLIFVPPISCGIPNAVDNIFQPNRIGTMRFEGGLMIVAMKDSLVTVRIDGNQVGIGGSSPVPGNPDFVTYRKLDLFNQTTTPNTISVVAEGAVQVAMYGRNEPASFAAFYSGFSKLVEPEVHLTMQGDGICPDTLVAHGRFDGIQWMLGDSILPSATDTYLITYTPGRYIATGYLGVCRRTDFAADTLEMDFIAPGFDYALQEPSCFGYRDGHIAIHPPQGGMEPYEYSIDRGLTFSAQNTYTNLPAGHYDLVVRDAVGCYNRPVAAGMGQPDSFLVDLISLTPAPAVKPGARVVLKGVTDRPVLVAEWEPADSTGCVNCPDYSFHPEISTWVTLTVYDSAGCRANDSLLVLVEPRVYAPNVINPASVEGNDRFMLFTREPVPIHRLAIFDRWGEQLFEKKDIFTNHTPEGWDGTFRGDPALPGVYVFVAEVEILPGQTVLLRGDVLLVR